MCVCLPGSGSTAATWMLPLSDLRQRCSGRAQLALVDHVARVLKNNIRSTRLVVGRATGLRFWAGSWCGEVREACCADCVARRERRRLGAQVGDRGDLHDDTLKRYAASVLTADGGADGIVIVGRRIGRRPLPDARRCNPGSRAQL